MKGEIENPMANAFILKKNNISSLTELKLFAGTDFTINISSLTGLFMKHSFFTKNQNCLTSIRQISLKNAKILGVGIRKLLF